MNENHRYYPRSMNAKLGYVVEECGEVMAAIGKTLRWGLESRNPEITGQMSETNREWIMRELQDLRGAVQILEDALEHEGAAKEDQDAE